MDNNFIDWFIKNSNLTNENTSMEILFKELTWIGWMAAHQHASKLSFEQWFENNQKDNFNSSTSFLVAAQETIKAGWNAYLSSTK